jgi:ABC-type transport system substrate-binding protein
LISDWKYSQDNKKLTLHVRKGVKFHDGEKLNAEAVKINLQNNKDGLKGTTLASIESMDIIDEYTLQLNLKEFINSLIPSFSTYVACIISPKIIEQVKTKKLKKKKAKKYPVGTGPFKFVSFERDVMTKYERFDGYWQKGKPYLDGIELVMIKDKMTAEAALRAGEVHVVRNVPVSQVANLRRDGYKVEQTLSETAGLAVDSGNPGSIYANKLVREAVEHAIDRESIAQVIGHGNWYALNQFAVKGTYGYNPDIKGRPYDPEKAKKLLTEAGYPNGFKTNIIAVGSFPGAQDGGAAMQANLMKAGINAKVELMDGGKYFQKQFRGWKDGLLLFGFYARIDPLPDLVRTFKTGGMRFPSMMRSPELDEIMHQAERATELKSKKELTQKAVRWMYDMAMVIPLWAWSRINIMHQSVMDAELDDSRYRHWTPEKAWLKK